VRVLRGLHESSDLSSEEGLVQDLALLLEDKDWYTGQSHSRSVGKLALRLGQALKEGQGWDLDLDILGRAGLLHDIGKLRVPWSLLNKIAPITPKEWSLLRDHSLHGADLLSKMGMGPVGMVVLQHHEALDGSGYPEGKAPGKMASIVAVCDVYEATVTPNRRYKVPKGSAHALNELRREAGRLYHPQVVEALAVTLGAGAA
jgi:HD-GYP domain-containing protein (c-di-GMP phosphodiesterase class II)